jgi:uncharacterized repeat protein (TIGR03803 family)
MKMAKPILLQASFLLLLLSAVSAFGVRPEKVLLSFDNVNGQYPRGMSMDANGNLWTVTSFGGSGSCPNLSVTGCGTVVEFTPSGADWKAKVIYNFRGGNDGADPVGNLVFDSQGNIYGATFYGGGPDNGEGTVFKLAPVSGGWKESVIYRFHQTKARNDGSGPMAGPIVDAAGNLYGTTAYGGNGCSENCGTVYELSPAANGTYTETILYNFKGGFSSTDGQYPQAPLLLDTHGNLYGTTVTGGDNDQTPCKAGVGCGVVFELSLNGSGGWTESVIHNFGSGGEDGVFPYAGLTLDANGNLYGTTAAGGSDTCSAIYQPYCGIVFELSPSSGGTWPETILHTFSNGNGFSPQAGLMFDAAGNLYGTTNIGGLYDYGTAFELSPSNGGWKAAFLHSFGNGQDGEGPDTGLVTDAAGDLYGGTTAGGTDVTGPCTDYSPYGCGTVFEIMP